MNKNPAQLGYIHSWKSPYLVIDDEALALEYFETKEDNVVTVLREFINRRKQQEIIQLFGALEPDLPLENPHEFTTN